jgi:putative ABC transport system permease protein
MNTLHRPSIWALSWRSLWRDLRAGDLRLLIVAVTLAVAALTAVGFFADRLQGRAAARCAPAARWRCRGVQRQPAARRFPRKRRARSACSTAETVGFPTMGRASDAQGGASKLVALKACRPAIRCAAADGGQQPGDAGQTTREIPAPGEAWVDAPLLDALNLKMGDALLLGDASLRIARMIVNEPDRGAGFMSFAPRVMINHADVAATGLVQPASRVTYRVAVAGDDRRVREFAPGPPTGQARARCAACASSRWRAAAPRCARRWTAPRNSSTWWPCWPPAARPWRWRWRRAALRPSHLDDCAMLRVLGQSQRTIAGRYTPSSRWSAWPPVLLGVAIGFGVHHVFVLLLAGLVDSACPRPACGRPRLAWASGSRCWWPLACRRCCNWPRCRRCA